MVIAQFINDPNKNFKQKRLSKSKTIRVYFQTIFNSSYSLIDWYFFNLISSLIKLILN